MTRWLYLSGPLFAGLLTLAACAAPPTPRPLSLTPATPPATAMLIQALSLPSATPRPPQASQTASNPEITTALTPTPATFSRLTSTQPITLTAIQMFNAQVGWGWTDFLFDDYYPHLLRTADGGYTWRDVSPPVAGGSIKTATWTGEFDFINDTEGWVIAYTPRESSLLHTTDGGWTWTQLQPQLIP